LSAAELQEWADGAPPAPAGGSPVVAPGPAGARAPGFQAAARALSAFVQRGEALLDRLPGRPRRSEAERLAGETINRALTDARVGFLTVHDADLYHELSGGLTRPIRVEQLVADAARQVPGLTPAPDQLAAERERPLSEKEGVELAQGILLAHVLALPVQGAHLVRSMLAPTPRALELLPELRARGEIDLGSATVTRRGPVAVLEHRNPRHLNAEDSTTLDVTETAVDLILLDPEVEIGVVRGGVVDHPRYAGRRIFGAGINLTHLYQGRVDYLFYMVRDLGYVSKLYRGLIIDDDPARSVEKLWVAGVEVYAIGGACQLLHVIDHVIATRGSRLSLPARNEGIIPGASNLRLARSVGARAARQAILSGREWTAGDPDAAMLIDEVVEPDEMDAALDARVQALTSSGMVNAAANRRALRVGEEPLDVFRQYMSLFAREQAYCHLSPALVRNLERHWNAAGRAA
jgi:thioesterase DpgC